MSIEVEVRRGLFSRRSGVARKLDLPLIWTVDRRSAKLFFGPALLLAFAPIGMLDALLGLPWFGIFFALLCACLACLLLRRRSGLYRLRPGRLTIDSDGFTDDRIGEDRIPWRCVRFISTCHERRSSRVSGVMLLLDGDRFTKVLSDDYRKAYLPLVPMRLPALFVDLAGNAEGREIAEAVRVLVEAAKFDRTPSPHNPSNSAVDR